MPAGQHGAEASVRVRQNGDIVMMMITSTGDETDVRDGKNLRRLSLGLKVPIVTTVAGARATAQVGPLVNYRRSRLVRQVCDRLASGAHCDHRRGRPRHRAAGPLGTVLQQ